MIAHKAVEILNTTFLLTTERAIVWPDQKCLILSDLHLGKTTHFRQSGIAVPGQVAQTDLNRLKALVRQYNCSTVLIVGDFFHAAANPELAVFQKWKSDLPLVDFMLIKGNHDRLHQNIYHQLNIKIVEDCYTIADFQFVHQPEHCNEEQFSFSGHIHPGVSIRLKGRQRVKLPCYLLNENQLILPAFSKFTGLDTRYGKQRQFQFFGITDSSVIQLSEKQVV